MYLGLDLGTSGIRALLVNESGMPIGEASASSDVSHPHPGWSEQDPAQWIAACEAAITELKANHGSELRAVRAIGLSGHMHGATLLDKDHKVLRPCMLWNDTRSAQEAQQLDSQDRFRTLTGNIVFPGFTAPKVDWVRVHEPDVFSQVAKILLPKDYLRLWLTGDCVSDMSDSAGTAWLDVDKRNWSGALLDACQLTEDQMPSLVEGSESSGGLRAELLSDWGIEGPVIVAGGGGDNAAAACGLGCLQAGDGFVSLGTSGVLLAATDTYAPAPEKAVHSFCHAIPNTWFQMGVTLAATDSLNWLAKICGSTPAELASALPEMPTGPSSATFLPYISGERTPHNDASPSGVFAGLSVGAEQADLTSAVMEGVAFSLKDCLNALRATGTNVTSLITTGGGTRSRFWLNTLANVLDVPLQVPAKGEFGAALGAARLGMAAVSDQALTEIMTKPEIAETIEPNTDLSDAYAARYEQFKSLYPAVKSATA
ncbi:xylulokinase [Cognatishimia activa]|uniref:Xylulose kinase n=1 Tax=Cognatishimia activa TaxID=1715691 RepID=A0A0P1IPR7_9RHOB|nr:xylulokinase [Cognatishimia activa]CUI86899.1 Xylulose kinase [Cognatishimia activa]CUK25596.1 Xylulose kinase [Cognatishimia activa]